MYLMILYFRWSGRGWQLFLFRCKRKCETVLIKINLCTYNVQNPQTRVFLTSWALIFQCKNTCFTIKPAHFPKNNNKKIFPGLSLFSGEAGFFLSNLPHIDSLCSNAVRKKWRKGHDILASDINASSHIQGDLHTIVQRK